MRVPLTLGDRDVVADIAADDVTVAELVATAGDAPIPGGTVAAAALRPGGRLGAGPPEPPPEPGLWAVHVVAGVDAGRVVPFPPADAHGRAMLTLGRAATADVRLASPAVSQHHCTLTLTGDAVAVADAGSRNGTVIGARRVGAEPVTLEPGQPVRCGPVAVVVRRVVAPDAPRSVDEPLLHAATGAVPFYRSPVDLPGPPPDPVVVPAPPRRPRTGRPGLIGFLLPLVLAGVMIRLTGQWMYAAFALMSPMMMLVTTMDRAGRNRRIRRKSRRRYRREIVEFADELTATVAAELHRQRTAYPDLAELVRRAEAASARLWDRRRSHPQFLRLALGLGDVPWNVPLSDDSDEALEQRDIAAAIDAAGTLRLAPVAIGLPAGDTLGMAGDRTSALALARGLVLQAAVHHGPGELRVVLATSQAARPDWDWLKWLPHVRPSSFAEGRLLVAVADADGMLDGALLDDVVIDAQAGAGLLVVVDTLGLTDAGDLAVKRLLRRDGLPTSGMVLAPTTDLLPDLCDVVVELHDTAGEATCRWPRQGGQSIDLVIGGVSAATAERAARALARFSDPDAGGGSAALPARIGQAAILGLDGAAPADIAARWATAGPLTAVVGLGEGGPVTVDFDTHGPHLLVVGGRGSGKTEHLAALALALAATHPPERLHLMLWGESFSHLHRLPHVASIVNRVDENATTAVADGLDRELTRRERLRTKGGSAAHEPKLVVVVDDVDTITRLVPKAAEDLVRLLRRARGLGVHVAWSTGRMTGGVMTDLVDLSTLRLVLRVQSGHESTELLGTDASSRLERSLPGRGYLVTGRSEPREVHGGVVSTGAPAPAARLEVVEFPLVRQLATSVRLGPPDERALVALLAAAGATSARPTDLLSPAAAANTALESPGLLELLGLDGAGALDAITDTWHTADNDAFLRVPIGVDPEMRPVLLDLKESALAGMGPHGLLVGATGSGKSELLRTLVSALAATHSPEMLAFVLVDFKGGASFAGFGGLPHVAGVVTNLADDMALIDRILAALGGEQKRRQELLAAAGNLANVGEYRAAYRAGTLPEHLRDVPLPQLLVIVDEFAELLDQEPAFIEFFLTIGRVGRSLGIHLLLASQRLEEGKLRGLDTYLSYRLGLRTFSASESRTVLGVPDAYSLPSAPGGGYLKVGNTSFERFQASYVSGPAGDGHNVMQALVERLAGAAPRVHQIWLPPLGAELPLDRLFGRGGFVDDPERGFTAATWPRTGQLALPVGVVDEPEQQRQVPLVLDLAGAHGNLAIVGAPQSGKSVLLRTMALSLAATHTPDEVQIYAVDLGGGSLEAVTGLPHVGSVATRQEPDLVHRLVGHVESLLADREELFREHGIDSAATFRARRAAGELPAGAGADVVLMIDGWGAFRERFDALEGAIVDLVARGLGYGIHVVLTANRWMEIRANVLDPIGGRLELRVNDPLDSNVDRRKAATIRPDQPGRGLHPSKRVFQIALPRLDGADTAANLQAATKLAAQHIAERWHGVTAAPVRLLPVRVTAEQLDEQLAEIERLDPAGEIPVGIPVGLQEAGMRPWALDLSGTDPHFMVFGDGESGKTTFLRAWLRALVARVSADAARVVLVDYRRTLLEVVPEGHLGGYAASEPAARDLVDAVAERMEARLPGADVTPAQLRDRSWWSGPDIYVVVDDYDLVATTGGNPLTPLLPYLAQGRDLGLHLVTARRVAGSAKSMFEPISARCREVSPYGLVMSGERDEGIVLGATRASRQPPGRGVLVSRHQPTTLVQIVHAEEE